MKSTNKLCFEFSAAGNSASSQQVFTRRGCKGNAFTWAALIEQQALQYGRIGHKLRKLPPGINSGVAVSFTGLGATWLAFAAEGDIARVCSDSDGMLQALKLDTVKINSSAPMLEGLLDDGDARDFLCAWDAGTPEAE